VETRLNGASFRSSHSCGLTSPTTPRPRSDLGNSRVLCRIPRGTPRSRAAGARPERGGGRSGTPAVAGDDADAGAGTARSVDMGFGIHVPFCRSGNFVCESAQGRAPSTTHPAHRSRMDDQRGPEAQHREQWEASVVRSPRARPKRRTRRERGRRDVRARGLGRAVCGAGAVLERRSQSAARRHRR
jgi:hypothetical protein